MKTVNTIAAFVNKYLIYIMILLMIVSYFFPQPFLWIPPRTTILLSIIMFCMGMTLNVAAFKMVVLQPKAFILGGAFPVHHQPFGGLRLSAAVWSFFQFDYRFCLTRLRFWWNRQQCHDLHRQRRCRPHRFHDHGIDLVSDRRYTLFGLCLGWSVHRDLLLGNALVCLADGAFANHFRGDRPQTHCQAHRAISAIICVDFFRQYLIDRCRNCRSQRRRHRPIWLDRDFLSLAP